jgi:hypothetical protein
MRAKYFKVSMGQAFREALPSALNALGGYVYRTELDASTTLVQARVRFTGRRLRTADGVQAALWREHSSGPWIQVEEMK